MADSKMLDSASQNPLPNIVEDVDENGDDDVQVIDGTYVEVNPLQKKVTDLEGIYYSDT